MIKTNEVKEWLLFYFLYTRNFLCATTEMYVYDGSFIADIIALSPNYKIYEVEIKTNINDLKNELNSILSIKKDKIEENKKLSKYRKHRGYLNKIKDDSLFIPHKFYFAIPYEDKEYVLKILSGTSYGLMDLHGNILKTAKDLHNEPIEKQYVEKTLQRISRVNYKLLLENAHFKK